MIADHLGERGFVVDAVGRGEDALAAIAVASYDAVILDLGLPDVDGTDVLAALRGRRGADLPALILTARDAVEDRVQGLNAGADDYLIKPFDLAELEARLRAVLRRRGVAAALPMLAAASSSTRCRARHLSALCRWRWRAGKQPCSRN